MPRCPIFKSHHCTSFEGQVPIDKIYSYHMSTFSVFCCVTVILSVNLCDPFSHVCVASLILGQSYDCLNTSEVTMKNMDKNLPLQNHHETQQILNRAHITKDLFCHMKHSLIIQERYKKDISYLSSPLYSLRLSQDSPHIGPITWKGFLCHNTNMMFKLLWGKSIWCQISQILWHEFQHIFVILLCVEIRFTFLTFIS